MRALNTLSGHAAYEEYLEKAYDGIPIEIKHLTWDVINVTLLTNVRIAQRATFNELRREASDERRTEGV